jgi:hypothetical protein
MSETREFRIYTSEHGSRPVVKGIYGEERMEQAVVRWRDAFPGATIVVREVVEVVTAVYRPDLPVVTFPPPDPIRDDTLPG